MTSAPEQNDSVPAAPAKSNTLALAALVALLGVFGVASGELVIAAIRHAHDATIVERGWLFADLFTFELLVVLLPLTLAIWVVLALVRSRTNRGPEALFELAWGGGTASGRATAAYIAGALALFLILRAIAPHIPTERAFADRPLEDASALASLALILVIGRLVVWRRRRPPFGWVLELLLLVFTCWFVGFELTYLVVPIALWYAPFVLAVAWGWIALRAVSRLSAPHRRTLGIVAGGLAVSCSVATVATYDVVSARHAALTWDTSIGAALWQTVKFVTDDDGDGYTDAFGGPDCDDSDPETHPGLPEDPANGRDDNCVAGETKPLPSQPITDEAVSQSGPRLNVVVVTIDTLRADYVGREVAGRSITPHLDAFADTATVFEHAYAASSHTAESVPAAWTGTYPFDWRQHGLAFGIERSLAEITSSLGYEVWATIAMTWTTADSLVGFDEVDNEVGYPASFRLTSDVVTQRSLQRLDARDPGRPFLMWTHFFDPHAPRYERADLVDWLGSGDEHAMYMHEIVDMDEAFGRLIEGLRTRALLDDTIVVVFSDHGESLGEHGVATHKRNGHDAVMRVPLMIRVPGQQPHRSATLVSTVDLLPTLADLLGIDHVTHLYGRSLQPAIRGEPLGERDFVYFSANEGRPIFKGIATTDRKLIYDWQRNAYFFYDLALDPGERRNLVDARPAEFAELRARFWQYWDAAFSTPRLARKAMKQKTRQPAGPTRYRGPPLVAW